jgi:hypothetical protein
MQRYYHQTDRYRLTHDPEQCLDYDEDEESVYASLYEEAAAVAYGGHDERELNK